MKRRVWALALILVAALGHTSLEAQQRDSTLVPGELAESWDRFWSAWEGDETEPFENVLAQDAVVASARGIFVGRAAIFDRWLGPAVRGSSVGFRIDPLQFLTLEDGILEIGRWGHGYHGAAGEWTTGVYSQLWVRNDSGWHVRVMTVGGHALNEPTADSRSGLRETLAQFRAEFSAASDPAAMTGLFTQDGRVVSLEKGWVRKGSAELEALWASGFERHEPFPRDVVYTDTRALSEDVAVVEGRFERGSAEIDGQLVPAQQELFTLMMIASRGRWRIAEARAGGWKVDSDATGSQPE